MRTLISRFRSLKKHNILGALSPSLSRPLPRRFHTEDASKVRARYRELKQRFESSFPLTREEAAVRDSLIDADAGVAPGSVFGNADTPMKHCQVVGLDYDYTMVTYKDTVHELIYAQAKHYLVHQLGYPSRLLQCSFDPKFPIRGLFFDCITGYMLKLDQFGKIAHTCTHFGRRQVSAAEVVACYGTMGLSDQYRRDNLWHMADLFCYPEVCLLADAIECMNADFAIKQVVKTQQPPSAAAPQHEHHGSFEPMYLQQDVRKAIDHVHLSGDMHNRIGANPELYLDPNPRLGEYLEAVRASGRKLFCLTNSHYNFVSAGMKFILGDYLAKNNKRPDEWQSMFDVTIVGARKPSFFTRDAQFRKIDRETGHMSMVPVTSLNSEDVYTAGGLEEMLRLFPEAKGPNTLYCGDHIFADLVKPSKHALWRTCAIIKELEHEITSTSTVEFRTRVADVLALDALIECGQCLPDIQDEIQQLKDKRSSLRRLSKEVLNPYFGSVFRTKSHRTQLFFKAGRYADIYTSSIINFLNYAPDHCFYTGRSTYPHEKGHAF